MRSKYIVGILAALLLCCQSFVAAAAGITNYSSLVSADYWNKQNKNGDKLLLDEAGVQAFNAKVREVSRTVYDMSSYPTTVSGDSLKTRIMNYQVLEDELYLHGNKVSDNYKNILRAQTNTKAIADTVNVRYAVTVRRTSVRNLPTGEPLYYYAADHDFDALQETELDPGEPLAVLHQSANGFFYYVQSYNYSGWVSKFNVALTDKKIWSQFAAPKNFLVVTDANYVIKTGNELVSYQQGARLPISAEQSSVYVVEAPVRLANGNLQRLSVNVPKVANAVHRGYLPYTSNNVVRSAFKFYGMPYGWGGLNNSVDCSSLLLNAYRTVGIILPRNEDEQEATAGTRNLLESLSAEQKTSVIKELQPGAGLFMDGHVVLYLGMLDGRPYTIHALGSYFANGARRSEMSVVVSDLTLQRASGKTFLEDLSTAVEFF